MRKSLFRVFYNAFLFLRLKYSQASTQEAIIAVWQNITRARILEAYIFQLKRKGALKKRWIFLGSGQEAGPASILVQLQKEDSVITPYRGYIVPISRGVSLRTILAEILEKVEGAQRGIGASGNFTNPYLGLYQSSALIGTDFGIALGMGIAVKQRAQGEIVTIFFGDGSTSRGALWSALNMSVMWKLPILWVCENNKYSVTIPSQQLTKESFFMRARSIGMRTAKIDGNNALACFFYVRKIIASLRGSCSEPFFLELDTYRLAEHDLFSQDNIWAQSREERMCWISRDALAALEKALCWSGIATNEFLQQQKELIQKELYESGKNLRHIPTLTQEEFLRIYKL